MCLGPGFEAEVGTGGYAYAVARNGDLIAQPDISLVLQRDMTISTIKVIEAFKPESGGRGPHGAVVNNLPESSFQLVAVIRIWLGCLWSATCRRGVRTVVCIGCFRTSGYLRYWAWYGACCVFVGRAAGRSDHWKH